MTLEADFKREVKDYFRRTGVIWFPMNSGKVAVKRGFIHLCEEGTADLLVFQGAMPYWIELKGTGQKTKKERAEKQESFDIRVTALGHRHAKCQTLDEVIEFLRT